MPRTVDCTPATRSGRRTKAEQFYAAADTVRVLADEASDVADAYVTLLVHAGIAAADVICCARRGVHARGESHADAVTLLGSATPEDTKVSGALHALLTLKTKAGYSDQPTSAGDLAKAERAADRLLQAMREIAV